MSDNYDDLRAALDWNGPKNPGLKAARRYATWYLGDPNWADNILLAFLDPEKTNRAIRSRAVSMSREFVAGFASGFAVSLVLMWLVSPWISR